MYSRNTWYVKGRVLAVTSSNGRLLLQVKGMLFRPKLFEMKCTTDFSLPIDDRIKRGSKITVKGNLFFNKASVRFIPTEVLSVKRG